MACPQNIKMFVWRLKHNSLALCTNLEHRGVRLDSTRCFFCGRVDEDGAHLFVKCKAIKEVWRLLELEGVRMKLEETGSVHEILDFLWTINEQNRTEVLTLWWLWWHNRNKVREAHLCGRAG